MEHQKKNADIQSLEKEFDKIQMNDILSQLFSFYASLDDKQTSYAYF